MLTPFFRYLLRGRTVPIGFAALLTTAAYAAAQAPATTATETQTVVRPTATIIQIETLALVAGLGTGLGSIGIGIRSAAKIITDYLTKRDVQEVELKKAAQEHEKAMLGIVSGIVDRYYNDRGAATGAMGDLGRKLDDVLERLEDVENALPAVARQRQRRQAVMPHVHTTASDDTGLQKPV